LNGFDENGRLVSNYISEGLVVQLGYGSQSYLQKGKKDIAVLEHTSESSPDWFDDLMLNFVSQFFTDDTIRTICIGPRVWETIYTRDEASRCKDFRLVKVIPVKYWKHGQLSHVWGKTTVDLPNHNRGTFLFEMGKDVYGILEDRTGFGYLLPYTFQKIQRYPNGQSTENLQQEVQNARII